MDTKREVFDKLSKLPGTQVNQHRKSLEILFPAAKDAYYNFLISLLNGGEPQITASNIYRYVILNWLLIISKFNLSFLHLNIKTLPVIH